MEHESPYGELALTCPDGQIVHHLDWQSDHPVALLKNVHRLTAPNPGVMTGPGTNTYWVGDPQSGFIVIDPGPADPDHLEKIWRSTGGQIRMIVCTHSHPDHSPGAKPLQALCQQQAGGMPPILGLSSASTANAQSQFKPDRELEHGEVLKVGEHSLKVLHTPGHAANHLCLALLEDGLLFTGDHVLNGSTTVVNPPDGSMNDYLDSLDLLARECQAHQLEFILPAHHCPTQSPSFKARSQSDCGHARFASRHFGRLGGTCLQRRARALVACGCALIASPRRPHSVDAAWQPLNRHP
jgi:recombination protein RecT